MNAEQINEAIVKYLQLSGYPKIVKHNIIVNYSEDIFDSIENICSFSFNNPAWAGAHHTHTFDAAINNLKIQYPYLSDESANIIGNMAAFFMK